MSPQKEKKYALGEVDFWIFLDFQIPKVCN
jgi:hypothetical protein